MPFARRFPPPWTVDEANNACLIVKRDIYGRKRNKGRGTRSLS